MARGFKTGGRVAGTPNRDTAERIAVIEACFGQIGGAEALARWARRNRTEFYTKVWARLLPREISVSGDGAGFQLVLGDQIIERLERARGHAGEQQGGGVDH